MESFIGVFKLFLVGLACIGVVWTCIAAAGLFLVLSMHVVYEAFRD